jgi:hypothetical protein
MKLTKGLLIAAMSATVGLASTGASAAFNDFDVEEGVIGVDTADNEFTADKITGNYVEIVTFNDDFTFDVSIKWEAGQFVADDGTTLVGTQLGSFGDEGYGLYALFTSGGTFIPDGAGGAEFIFDAVGGLTLYSDEDQDTTFNTPINGSTAWTTNNSTDDDIIGTGNVLSGGGVLDPTLSTCDPGINCGSFGTTTSFALTAFGETYFIDPDPFYNVAFESGQLNIFELSGTQEINGSLDVVFESQIPEPSTLALMGLGMAGIGFMRRRKNA